MFYITPFFTNVLLSAIVGFILAELIMLLLADISFVEFQSRTIYIVGLIAGVLVFVSLSYLGSPIKYTGC